MTHAIQPAASGKLCGAPAADCWDLMADLHHLDKQLYVAEADHWDAMTRDGMVHCWYGDPHVVVAVEADLVGTLAELASDREADLWCHAGIAGW